jgi:hypothetical protein
MSLDAFWQIWRCLHLPLISRDGDIAEPGDPTAIFVGEVPNPWEPGLSLEFARWASDDDALQQSEALVRGNLSFAQLWKLSQNALDWARFWEVRHPSSRERARFAKEAQEQADALWRIQVNAMAILAKRRGVV